MRPFFITIFCMLAAARPGFAETQTNDPEIDEIVRLAGGQVPEKNIGPSLDRLWDAANTAYINNDYAAAVTLYDSILVSGHTGYKLYYNLGNAWFKQDRIGKAILYYNKALRLRPSDPDIEHNLKVANTYVRDKIERVPEFFLKRWLREVRTTFTSNVWAAMGLAWLAVALGGALVYLLARRLVLRKAGFYAAIAALVCFVFAVVSASIERRALTDGREAVVMISAAAVKSSPEKSSKDIFVLHEGTAVEIVRTLGEWHEIAIADGNRGWVPDSAIERI